MTSDFIINVDESDFEFEVLQYSMHVPVLVDFWATWCVPCRVLGPKLEDLAREGDGRFRLAKLNVDENSKLTKKFKINNIPAVKAFVEGRVVGEFSGIPSDEALHSFIHRLAPAPEDLMLVKGNSMFTEGDYSEAEDAYRQFLSVQPGHPAALLGLTRALLLQGIGQEASVLLKSFPASPEYNIAKLLMPVAKAYTEVPDRFVLSTQPLDAAFNNSVRLAKRGNIYAALDGFLDILRANRRYRGEEVKGIFVGLLTLLGEDNPETRQYRQDLTSTLY